MAYLAKCVLSKKIVNYSFRIPGSNSRTISELENIGAIMTNRLSNGDMIPVYPTVQLANIIPYEFKTIFESVYYQDNTSICHGLNSENIIQNYHCLLLSLMTGETISLKNLFRFANMNSSTEQIMVKIPDIVKSYTSKNQIENEIDINSPIEMKNDRPCNLSVINNCFIVKNDTTLKTDDVLIFGLTIQDNPDKILVIHLQGKWSDSEDGNLTYEEIRREVEENNLFKFRNTNLKTRNITVISILHSSA